MSMISLPYSAGLARSRMPRRPIGLVIAAGLGRVLAWPVRVIRSRRTMSALGALDDRALRDIGLSRADLRDATALAPDSDPGHFLARRSRRGESLGPY